MPLLIEKEFQSGKLAVWKVEEDKNFFTSKLNFTDFDLKEIQRFNNSPKLVEWLSSRYLLKFLVNHTETLDLQKDEFGKPFLKNINIHCSLSHCIGYVAAIISKKSRVGIDIEKIHPRVQKIADRFLNNSELSAINGSERTEKLITLWSAKESLYKLYGRKKLDFRENLKIASFNFQNSGKLNAEISKDSFDRKLEVNYEVLEEHVLSWVSE